ncbi:hypothetical protein NS228_06175 [Methylobacterium indicum]|uniref:hypothetical protein n=1 Tax=Methylobacterium indicum TaxID=1775910 RepID=UPI000733F41E|nr:hypothetical protein [Methylobacterium indicum]KTS30866.1 hypothetical protein NS229_14655 [Methylobacterium indicum]KTS41546.1 hypothetical protein NS228_06175 [Methylobacterium indicum]KTS52400.1 hypothetical protein NS230_09740 [Methylobacterium indicum]
MGTSVIEAKFVLSGQDAGASAAVGQVVKAIKQIEEAGKVSKEVDKLARSLLETEKAQKAVSAAMAARNGLPQAQAGLRAASAEAARLAADLDKARAAAAAFNGVRLTRGSDQAKSAAEARRAVRELGAEYRKAEREVRVATAAVAAQTSTLHHAEQAAKALGADLGALESHERRLRGAVESTTQALRQQISTEERAAQAAAHHRREMQEYDRHMRRHGAIGAAAAAASGYVGVHTVAHGVKETIQAGARYQHEVVALRNAGRTPHEMHEIEEASRKTSLAVPTATFEENLKVINETTGAFGDLHHAIENLTFMQKSASVLHASAGDKIHEGAGELGNKLARFFEMRGTAGNTPVFQREAGELIRAMAFTRGNFNPREAVNFAQQAKSSLPLYNERFLTKIAPSLVTEYGGDRAGTAANAFRNVILGKANDKKQAEAWMGLGLLDPKKAIMKGGHAVSWSGGAVKDTNLALSDPLEWAQTVLLPAMRKKGINVDDKLELTKSLGTMFRNSNSNLFAEALTQKLSVQRLLKDEVNIDKAGTLDQIYDRNMAQDPTQGIKAVQASLENLISTASSPLMETAASGLKAVATGVQQLAAMAKDHPNLAVAGGLGVAGASFGAAGLLSYKLATGFGLSTSATALTHSAAMLDAAAVRLGGGEALKTAATAGAGAGAFLGIGMAGFAGGALLSGVATADQLPKVLKGKGPTSVDPATGGAIDTNPMGDLGPTIKEWWKRTLPVLLGGEPAKEAGRAAGQGVADGVKEKAPEVQTQGWSILNGLRGIFSYGVNIPINFVPGAGAGALGSLGSSGGSGIQTASFSPGGGGVGGVPAIRAGGRFGGLAVAGGGGGSFGGRAQAVSAGSGIGHIASKAERAAYIRQAAIARGIDPEVALRVAQSEGFNQYVGDQGRSFGDWQLFTGGGVGNRALAAGINIRDPNTWKQQTDFALDVAKREGWGQWYGAARVGIGKRQGLGQGRTVGGVPGMPDPGPGYMVPLHKGGTGLSRYSDEQLREMEAADAKRRGIKEMPRIPEGASFGGAFGLQGAVAEFRDAVGELRKASWRSHHTVEVSASPGLQARTRAMHASTKGPMRADLGVTMPGARIEGEWI